MHDVGLCRLDSNDDSIQSGVKRVSLVPLYCRWESTRNLQRVVQGLIMEILDSAASFSKRKQYRRIGIFESAKDINGWLEDPPCVEIELV